jgi:hypothetical protein
MKKIYLIASLLVMGFAANAQRNLKLDFQIIRPSFDTNIVTGSTLNYQYRITNNSATAADSIQKGDTVKFFDASCTYNPASTATIKFTSYVYFVASTSLPKGSSINVTPTTPLAFANIENLAELATLPSLSYKAKPFVNNKQYAWFVILYSVSKPTANIAIASLTGNPDTGRIWINKSTGLVEFANNKIGTINTYPNPATTSIKFSNLNRQSLVSIYSLAGQKVLEKMILPEESIQVKSLPKGPYLFRIKMGDQLFSGRFLKE